MEDKEQKILNLLDIMIKESKKNDHISREKKANAGIFDENGDSFMTFHLNVLKELILSK